MIKNIPNGWEQKKLKDIGTFSKGTGIPGYSYVDCGEPCIGYGDIYTTYNIQFNKSVHFTDSETARSGKVAKKGTLMFTGSGETAEEIGKCVCYTGEEPLYAGGDIIMYNTDKVNPVFLAYQQNVWAFIREKARFGQGHSVVHIHESELGELNCLYPKERKEQDKIVEVLDVWAKAVELQEQKVEKLKEKKKALMQKLLTPKGDWKSFVLGNKCTIKTGKLDANEMVENGEYPFFTCSKEIYKINKYAFDCEALLMAGNGEIGDVKYYNGKFNAYQRTYVLYDFGFNARYIMYFLLQNFDRSICKGAQKSSMPYIKLSLLTNAKIEYPDNYEEITDIFKCTDNLIEKEEVLLSQYKEQQKALMQKLLTGEIRVNG